VIVLDTSALSVVFRRSRPDETAVPAPALVLKRLIAEDVPMAVPGIVLQELLSGVAVSAGDVTNRISTLICSSAGTPTPSAYSQVAGWV